MYTELVISTRVKDDPVAVEMIKVMLGLAEAPSIAPKHELFTTDRWCSMLRCSSYYFVPRSTSLFEYDKIGRYWCFISRSDFKNYDGEVAKFIDWIRPYLRDGQDERLPIGYYRYEEDAEATFIYSKD